MRTRVRPATPEALLKAVETFYAVPEPARVSESVVRQCMDLLPLCAAAVLLLHPEPRSYWLAASAPDPLVGPLRAAIEHLLRDPDASAEVVRMASDAADGPVMLTLQDAQAHGVGLLIVQPHVGIAWNQPVQQALETLATHAGLALHNAQLMASKDAALRERVIELSTIEVVSRQLSAALDLRQIAGEVLAAAISATGARRGRCVLLSQSGEQILAADYAPESPVPRAELCTPLSPAADHTVVGHVLRTQEALLIADVLALQERPGDLAPDVRSVLGVPIVREGQVYGVLSLEDTRANAFGRAHRRLAQMLGEHAAIAIENALLYQQVRVGRDQLQAILDSTDEGLMLFDREGRLLRFNAAAQAMVGLELDVYLGKGPACWVRALGAEQLQALAGITPGGLRAYLRALQQKPTAVQHRHFVQALSDQIRHIDETRSPVLDPEGRVDGWLLNWRDTTEQHRLERLRLDLSAMIVHDLRNPITAITSSLMMLRDMIIHHETDPNLQLEVVDIAVSSANYMFNLVQSILEVSRLEQNSLALECESTALEDCVNYALKSVFSQALTANIVLSSDLPTDLPPAWIDAEEIQRVLINLLDNAVRHTPQHGQVRLSARADRSAGVIVVCVQDSGPGIPPEARARIFDKFIQLDHQALRGHKGTGLGLTFCKLAVEAHGGQIWVEQAPEGGALFCFTVPIAPRGTLAAEG